MNRKQAINNFIELDKQKPQIRSFFENYRKAVNELVEILGENGHFQDDEGTVYQIVVPEGKFVAFEKYSVNRTRRQGEKRGDLSLSKARELGYEVE